MLSHGWSDGLIPAENTVGFFKAMTSKMDSKTAQDAVRLFMVPGMGHCGGGDGLHLGNMITVIDQWTDKGKAPDTIVATGPPKKKSH